MTGMPNSRPSCSLHFPAGAALLVALAAVAAHLPGLLNGFTNWDDDHYLTLNTLVLQLTPAHVWQYFSSFQLGNYHPLTLLAHALWHHVFGLAPLPHHALNLALHAANAVLVLALFDALGMQRPGALIAALLFATNPLQVEVVAWTAQLKTLLATLFFLAALLAYLRRLDDPVPRFPASALALTACSLLAKPAAVLMPVILVLIDRVRGRATGRRVLWEKAPFALLALLSGGVTLFAQQGAFRPATMQPLAHGPFVASHGVLFLLAKAVAPVGLSALYPYPERASGGLPWTFLVAPAALAVLATVLWRLGARSRDVRYGTLFFLAMLAPTLQVIPVGFAHTADRYFYLPSIGLFFLVGRGIDRMATRESGGTVRRRAIAALLLLAVVVSGTLSWRRTSVWHDGVSLWSDVVAKRPSSYVGWGNLGQALATTGNLVLAESAFERALDLAGPRFHRAKILFDRGSARQEAGDQTSADADYSLGLEIDPDNTRVLVNRGNARDALGRPREALEDYARAIALDPGNSLAWYNRGVTLAGLGEHAIAVESFDRALNIDPGYAPGFGHRAKSLAAIGRLQEAAEDLRRAARLESPSPHDRQSK